MIFRILKASSYTFYSALSFPLPHLINQPFFIESQSISDLDGGCSSKAIVKRNLLPRISSA